MLPDLGRLIRLLYATIAAIVALRIALGRWRASLAVVGGAAALALAAGRLLRQRRPVAPDGWPPAGRPALALATGDGVWRIELASGRTFAASSTGEPTLDVRFAADRLRASGPLAWRETGDWRSWTVGWPPAGAIGWTRPARPALAAAADLPRRGDCILALSPDERGGLYVGTGRWLSWLAMRLYLAAPSGRLAGLAVLLLARRWGRLFHVDRDGTRRLLAAGLPPIFAIAAGPTEGALAGPPSRLEIGPMPTGPAPSVVGAEAVR